MFDENLYGNTETGSEPSGNAQDPTEPCGTGDHLSSSHAKQIRCHLQIYSQWVCRSQAFIIRHLGFDHAVRTCI
jgi:hypothetical protein